MVLVSKAKGSSFFPLISTRFNSASAFFSLAMVSRMSVSVMSVAFGKALPDTSTFSNFGSAVTSGGGGVAGVVLAEVSIMLVLVMSGASALPVTSTLFNASAPEAAPASVGGFKASTCEAGNAPVSEVPFKLSLTSSIVPAILPFD